MSEEIVRVPTGIAGLDKMLEGGIPKGYTVLVAGGPGSGKSTLAMQFIYNGITKYGENGIYATLQENPDEMKTNFSRFGWNLDKVDILALIPEKAGELEDDYILPARIEKAEDDIAFEWFSSEQVKKLIAEKVKETGATRIVIDSLAPLLLQIDNSFSIRQEILDLVTQLKKLGCTTLLITEMPEGQKGVSRFDVEEFMSQGIIVVYNIPKGSERVRGLEILKMRGTNHSKKICLMDIAKNGIVVYSDENLHREI
ncbi:MAG: ATPase domain-containing protein [Candidatus Hydrothermarchaeales archaeon]